MVVSRMGEYPMYSYLRKNYFGIYENDRLALIEKY